MTFSINIALNKTERNPPHHIAKVHPYIGCTREGAEQLVNQLRLSFPKEHYTVTLAVVELVSQEIPCD